MPCARWVINIVYFIQVCHRKCGTTTVESKDRVAGCTGTGYSGVLLPEQYRWRSFCEGKPVCFRTAFFVAICQTNCKQLMYTISRYSPATLLPCTLPLHRSHRLVSAMLRQIQMPKRYLRYVLCLLAVSFKHAQSTPLSNG